VCFVPVLLCVIYLTKSSTFSCIAQFAHFSSRPRCCRKSFRSMRRTRNNRIIGVDFFESNWRFQCSRSWTLTVKADVVDLGHNHTFTAGKYAAARLHALRSVADLHSPTPSTGMFSKAPAPPKAYRSVPGSWRALIVHRRFILPHSRLATRLSDSTHRRSHPGRSLLRSFFG